MVQKKILPEYIPYCNNCNKVNYYIAYVGIFTILFLIITMILQSLVYYFYIQNKKKLEKLQIIYEEILVFFNNLLIIIQDSEEILHDINIILSEIISLEGEVQNTLNNILTVVPGRTPPVILSITYDKTAHIYTVTGLNLFETANGFTAAFAWPNSKTFPNSSFRIGTTMDPNGVGTNVVFASDSKSLTIHLSAFDVNIPNGTDILRIQTYGGIVPGADDINEKGGMFAAYPVPDPNA